MSLVARAVALAASLGLACAATAVASSDPASSSRSPSSPPPIAPSVAMNAVDFAPGSGSCGGNDEQSIGWQFNVDTEVVVTGMAWFDDGLDGLDVSHLVAIWDPSGEIVPGTNVTIHASGGTTLDGIWQVVSIDPVALPVGSGYIVGGYNGMHSECLSFNVDQIVHPALTYVDATYGPLGGGFLRPTNFAGAVNGFYGASFQLELGPVAVEGDSWGRVKAGYR